MPSSLWSEPPPGYKPGQTRAPLVWNIAVPVGAIALFLACLRFYVRACLVRVIGRDDWFLLVAVICFCIVYSGVVWSTLMGMGRHEYDRILEHMDTSGDIPVCWSSWR